MTKIEVPVTKDVTVPNLPPGSAAPPDPADTAAFAAWKAKRAVIDNLGPKAAPSIEGDR